MSEELTNAERGERARNALLAYNDEYDLAGNMVDFMADLQHYCHIAHGLDSSQRTFDDVLRIAREHFDAEVSEPFAKPTGEITHRITVHDESLTALIRAEFLMQRVIDGDHRAFENMPGAVAEARAVINKALRQGKTITIDHRFKLVIRRNAPPPMASAQLVIDVYPITDGEIWDAPYDSFVVDEGRIVELENEARRQS